MSAVQASPTADRHTCKDDRDDLIARDPVPPNPPAGTGPVRIAGTFAGGASTCEKTAGRAAGFLMRQGQVALCLFGWLLYSCAAQEVLVPKSGAVPAGVDFSGTWRLRRNESDGQGRINEAIRRTDGVDDRVILRPPVQNERDGSQAPPRRQRGGLVHLFLENGDNLKITQTPEGMFLSFDRAVVVEYRFGENRQVRVGPVLAERVSGWEGREYVAETLDENRMKLTERFSLLDSHTLRRTIILRGKNNEQRTLLQTFDRIG